MTWADFGFAFKYFVLGTDYDDIATVRFYPDKSVVEHSHQWPLRYGVTYGVAPWKVTAASAITVCFDAAAPNKQKRFPKVTWFRFDEVPKGGTKLLPPTVEGV